jgi:5'-methylthioadenosine phosphorylase
MSVAEIGIIGGSGVYRLLDSERELTVQTPYGPASDVISLGQLGGRQCAFIPRHGRRHSLPPHMIPFHANIFALKELGVTQIIGLSAVGALSDKHAVGSFACADQLVNLTSGRVDTFYDGPITTHIGFAEPYCPQMREAALKAAHELKLPCAAQATIVVVGGPRFSTRAESRFFAAQGWELENMTQYPEAALARELTLSYLNISLVTNRIETEPPLKAAAGSVQALDDGAEAHGVLKVIRERLDDLKRLVSATVERLPAGEQRPAFIREALKRGRWI